jgi:hypothetical protein
MLTRLVVMFSCEQARLFLVAFPPNRFPVLFENKTSRTGIYNHHHGIIMRLVASREAILFFFPTSGGPGLDVESYWNDFESEI